MTVAKEEKSSHLYDGSLCLGRAIQDATTEENAEGRASSLDKPQRLMLGGLVESADALRIVGLVKNLPLNLLDTPEISFGKKKKPPCFFDRAESDSDSDSERKKRLICSRRERKRRSEEESSSEESRATTVSPTTVSSTDERNSKRNPRPKRKSTTPAPDGEAKGTTVSCCKQHKVGSEDMSESALRRETARMNLDVLRRLASMLGEEREKFAAEREMLTASRDVMQAEMRKVNSERTKIESERQKLDLERDMLQSQMLGRRISS